MHAQSMFFKQRASLKLRDERLQRNLKKLATHFVDRRTNAMAKLDGFEAIRASAVARRKQTIARLDVWLERFEQEATRRGTTVLYASTPEEATQLVLRIAKQHQSQNVIKTKSMVTEEMRLDAALEGAGLGVTETDLGEYILQINGYEPPSHIIAPVVHKDKQEISELFARTHQRPPKTEIPQLTREAREVLRAKFMQADLGITGANFVIAETGSVALVTNEGNEGMCTIRPKVHIAITGIEKVLPTLEDYAGVMRLLARSATGQTTGNYLSLHTGPRRTGDANGPEHMYVILMDGGRSGLLGGDFEDMLRCIRCGACMNHCPVYQKIGGHAYGWVYPGPMGSVLTPSYIGLDKALDLPHAATLCGQCQVACPMSIPLPELLRKLRERQFERGLRPWRERTLLRLWAWVAMRPRLYRLASRMSAATLYWMARDGALRHLPLASSWTGTRDFPAPRGSTFISLLAMRGVASPPASGQATTQTASTSPTVPRVPRVPPNL